MSLVFRCGVLYLEESSLGNLGLLAFQQGGDEILRQIPTCSKKLGPECRTWTLELLVRYAKEYLEQEVCFQTISAAMRRCKYRPGRSKRVGSPDPESQVKRHQGEALQSLPARDS